MFLREFIFGNNQTGLVTNISGTVSVVGGEDRTLAGPYIPGQSEIFLGVGATQSSYVFPSATIAAWESFIATAVPGPVIASPPAQGGTQTQPGAAGRSIDLGWSFMAAISPILVMTVL